ncbi:MAG: PD-(D/E)XK nuclease family transposase [Ruminococcus sp.]|nr:PD-(D/E)XK nuclease family transposase [Ruminococcus sp.]
MRIDHASLIGTFEQKREQVRKFNLMDDDFFTMVMQDKGAFEVMLRILTGREDLHVKEVRTQYAMRNLVGHSVILDGYAEDEEHKAYNVEIQIKDSGYHEKRVRYYQSNIDLMLLKRSAKYEDLPDLYLIFITSFDLFHEGQNHYEIKRMLDGYQREIPNGIHELYFNTAVKDHTRVSDLMQYFKNSSSDNTEFGRLSDRVKYYKETEEGVSHMCDAVKNYGDERAENSRKHEKAKNVIQVITALMKNTKCTLEEALGMTDYTMEDYQNSIDLLGKS